MKVKINGIERDIWTLWREDSVVKMIDQRILPHNFSIVSLKTHDETAQAIKDMVCRGAGAIGCAAGFAMAQAAIEAELFDDSEFDSYIKKAAERIRSTRPTAVNLFHAVERCLKVSEYGTIQEKVERIKVEADNIAKEDLNASIKMGEYGNSLIEFGDKILTHCNAGALAFIDYGTALSPIRTAHKEGKNIFVWVDETRPRCQGARLTAWEMQQEGIPYALIVDNAAGYFMRKKEIDMVIVGADRIAANGDVANKIGTYEKAVVAYENDIPFYVAAPKMTFDFKSSRGDDIEIEERDFNEVTSIWGLNSVGKLDSIQIPAHDTKVRNPSFDITPSKYVTSFITEHGIIYPPYNENLEKVLKL